MAQRIKLQQNSVLINQMQLYVSCKNLETQAGFYSRLAGRPGRKAEKISKINLILCSFI